MSLNAITVKLFLNYRKSVFEKSMWWISILANFRLSSFHAVVVFGLGKNILFKYIIGHFVEL